MDAFIRPEGWDNWHDAKNEATAWYGEIGSTGPGAKAGERVKWSHQLTTAEAAPFLPDVYLRGNDGWNPVRH